MQSLQSLRPCFLRKRLVKLSITHNWDKRHRVILEKSSVKKSDLASFCLETAKTRVVTAYTAASGDGFLLSIA
ncbi:MAG: hypothetical protein DMG98_27095 [Acidobacteria bacterium]|nr:MAG: hypothetical protein DMG98_27095 [Acidobacteriota bacterium]